MEMLRLVRLRASIPITVVPLNWKGRGREKGYHHYYYCHWKSGVISSSDGTITQGKKKKMSGEDTSVVVTAEEEKEKEDVVVQYVVLRRDLIDTWPLGSVVTQGCHASVAAIWEHKDDASTLRYCSPTALDSMHKVTLEVKGEAQMVNLSEKLKSNGILHKLWVEQPENIPTCLATKPYPKSMVSPFFRRLKLCN